MIDQPLPADASMQTPPSADASMHQVRQTFLEWEWLRIWYNAILIAWVLLLTGYALSYWSHSDGIFSSKLMTAFWPQFVLTCLEGAVVSNFCFFLGPLVEAYVGWLGKTAPWVRPTLFWSGLAFTMLGAFVTIQWALLPLIFVAMRST